MDLKPIFTDKFHDSILIDINYNWGENSTKISIQEIGNIGITKLILEGIHEIYISHKNEWGKSIYINEIEAIKENNLEKLLINMQSGDTITFLCESLIFDR